MLDIFQRLTAKEGVYFLPQDCELSNQELSYIVKKAEQWRGLNGERRKVNTSLVSLPVSKKMPLYLNPHVVRLMVMLA